MSVKGVFGEPVEENGDSVIPVSNVHGGGGGGDTEGTAARDSG